MTTVTSLAVKTKNLRAIFGQDKTKCTISNNSIDLHLKIPIFGLDHTEYIAETRPGKIYTKLGFHLLENEDTLAGALVRDVQFPLESNTYEIYLNFLKLTQNWNLLRVWNYVPYINDDTDGLENYRSFCKGRSLAFESFYGEDFEVKLPAASAVGINDNKLVLYFVAGKKSGIHVENHEQISAFKYPQQYGPRSPSFARGTLVSQMARTVGYVSGTASIKGHESVTLDDVSQQLQTTLDNMSIVCEQMNLVERMSYSGPLPDPGKYTRHFKVYIRNESDVKYIQEEFPKTISATEADRIIYLRSDICRSDLDLEIEAIFESQNLDISSAIFPKKTVQNIDKLLLDVVRAYPNKTAIVYDRVRLNYQQLYNRIVGFSQGLRSLGMQKSDCAMVVLPNCPEFIISFYAIAKLQAIALPLNPMFKASEIQYYAEDSQAKVIITDQARAEVCRQVIAQLDRSIKLIIIDSVQSESSYFYHLFQTPDLDLEEPSTYEGDVIYQYSSGSTGRPKKLCRTQQNIFNQAVNCTTTLNITDADNILAMVPLYHAYGFGECMLAAMSTGATLVILEPTLQDGKPLETPLLFRRDRILNLIEWEQVSILPMVPYIASILATTPEESNVFSLRLCLSAGNFLSQDIFDKFRQKFGVPLRQLYGCTEAGAVCVNLEDESDLPHDSIGKPMQNVEIAIVDENGEECPHGTVGELTITSQTLTQGYHDRLELNRDVFVGGCFLTGDLGKKDEKERIYLVGRKKIFIDTGGHKVDPIEVEDVLHQHPQVKEAVVVGCQGFDGIEMLKAVIVPNGDCRQQDIVSYCQERIADFKVPRLVEFRTSLPKDPIFGKVKRKEV
ncbi:MAG: AMP-binding protein [Geitlerinemataceae cyanobacterium]